MHGLLARRRVVAERPKKTWTLCPCGKRGYSSESSARKCFGKVILDHEWNEIARKGKGSNRFGVYRCPGSGLWHLTDREKSKRMGKSRQERARTRHRNRVARRAWRRERKDQGD